MISKTRLGTMGYTITIFRHTHMLWKITIFNGKIHYFNGYLMGKSIKIHDFDHPLIKHMACWTIPQRFFFGESRWENKPSKEQDWPEGLPEGKSIHRTTLKVSMDLAMDQYLYTYHIFRGMNIHKSQLFWCEQKGDRVLTHPHLEGKQTTHPTTRNIQALT